MRATDCERRINRHIGRLASTGILALTGFLALSTPARADPLLLETGVFAGNLWFYLGFGLAVETLILAFFIRRTFLESLAVCLVANSISGFIGLIALLFLRLKGVPIIPPGPGVVLAILIEAPIITLMLMQPPVKKIAAGVIVANLVSGLIAFSIIAPSTIKPPSPTAAEDLALARGLVEVRNAIDQYYDRCGFYPEGIIGGSADVESLDSAIIDPLLRTGILDSYPTNPYAPYLRSRFFNYVFLLTGFGPSTHQVDLSHPTTAWEARWFPVIKDDSRFGDPDHVLLCANGLSDPAVRDTLKTTFYHMNGADCIPGCFFYKTYDFDGDGLADDYILGAYGWPDGSGTVAIDIIDGATGEIHLSLDSSGVIFAGQPDGLPEPIAMLYIGCTSTLD